MHNSCTQTVHENENEKKQYKNTNKLSKFKQKDYCNDLEIEHLTLLARIMANSCKHKSFVTNLIMRHLSGGWKFNVNPT